MVMDELRLSEEVAWRDVEAQVVALDVDATTYFAVNRTGATIWPLLAEGTRREELIARLVEVFGIDRSAAERDVDRFLEQLTARGLLTTE